jgi:hypothetical protein
VSTATLSITGATAPMNGNKYRCYVTATCPADTSNFATLTINAATQVGTEPINDTTCVNTSASLSLVANGGNLNYQWQVNMGAGFSNLTNLSPYSGVNTATLTVNPVATNMNGKPFRCIINGQCNPLADTSNLAYIVVNSAPTVTNHPQHTTICADADSLLRVVTTGSITSFQWQVDNGTGYANISNGAVYSGVNNDTLKLNNVPSGYNGYKYRCVITGSCGAPFNSNFAYLFVNAKPNVALDLSLIDTLCNQSPWVQLVGGTPANGVYSGPNVSSGYFNPTTAGAGTHGIIYTYTNASGCSASDTDSVFVDICIGANEINFLLGQASISPNPYNGNAIIFVSKDLIGQTMEITDITGRLIHSIVLKQQQTLFNIELPAGLYLYRTTEKSGNVISKKLVVE